MKINRILAAVCALLITANNMSFISSDAADSDEKTQLLEEIESKIPVTVDNDLIAAIVPDEKVYNGRHRDVFEGPLDGIAAENDDVRLAVTVQLSGAEVSDQPVTAQLVGVQLVGNDKDKYELIDNTTDTFFDSITITPRPLKVTVKNPTLTLGSEALKNFDPENVAVNVENGPDGRSVSGLGVKVTLDNFSKAVGTYGDLSLSWNQNNKNYTLSLDENAAVSVVHPVIDKISCSHEDAATINEHGIISSKLTVKVSVDTYQKTDTTLKIDFNGEEQSVSLKADQCSESNGKFTYTAPFVLTTEKGDSAKGCIYASASNDFCNIENQKLEFKSTYGGSEHIIDNIIIDNVESTASGKLEYNNTFGNGYFEVNLNVNDLDSGIKTIMYRVDGRGDWFVYGENNGYREGNRAFVYYENDSNRPFSYSHAPNADVSFKLRVPYIHSYKVENDDHSVDLRIIDNANITYNTNTKLLGVSNDTGFDQKGPQLVAAELIPSKDYNALLNTAEDEEAPAVRDISKIVNVRSYGTYFKEPFTVRISAKDESETSFFNGLSLIGMYENNQLSSKAARDFSGKHDDTLYERVFSYDKADAHPLGIRLEDTSGIFTDCKASEAFSTADCKLLSDNFVLEKSAPVISLDLNDKVSDYDDKVWFGKKGGKVVINVSDKSGEIVSGIGSIRVLLDNKVFKEIDFTEQQTDVFSIEIDTADLESGVHSIVVDASDNCGNPATTVSQEIRVDHSEILPVITPDIDPVPIDGGLWYKDNDKITFTASVVSPFSVVTSVNLYCNDAKLNEEDLDISFDEKTDTYKVSVTADAKDICDPHNLCRLHAIAVTNTQNRGDSDGKGGEKTANNVYHVDKGVPFIKNIRVERRDGALEKFFPHLGVFAHEDLIFKVRAADREYDSGLDHLEIIFVKDGEKQSVNMKYNKDLDAFVTEFPLAPEVFQSRILIRAVDKFGRVGTDFPNSKNVDIDSSVNNDVFTMIENIPPENDIILPVGDGKKREDDQIWYRTDKDISVTASDDDSGIYQINITVNGKKVDTDKNGVKIPDADFINSQTKLCTDQLEFVFDTAKLVEIAGEAEDGKYVVRVETFDLAGNPSEIVEKAFYIDKNPPAVSEFVFAPATEDAIESTDSFVDILEYGFYFKSDFNVMVKASDAKPSSGFDEVVYRFIPYDNGEAGEISEGTAQMNKDGEAVIKVPAGFKGQISAKAVDMTGNVSDVKMPDAFVADDVAPEITIENPGDSSHHDADGNALFTEDKSVRITISDFKSGLRSFGYSVSAEKNPVDETFTDINNTGHQIGDIINGWEILSMDNNLVTSVSRVIDFNNDDNGIAVNVIATDRSNNSSDWKNGQRFTIDKTNPVVNVSLSGGVDNRNYYSESQKAVIDITVKERNFSSDLFSTEIANSFTGAVPDVSFSPTGNPEEYHASITFPEGDFTFRFSGQDLGGHQADISSGGDPSSSYYTSFIVDYTKPVASADLNVFGNEGEGNFFNSKKSTKITVKEHNFNPELMNLRIRKKQSGSAHDLSDMYDSYYSYFSKDGWQTDAADPDTHSIVLEFPDDGSADGVYVVDLMPSDVSGNVSDALQSAVFEMDCTAPVIAARNGVSVAPDDYDLMDVYGYDRKDEDAPFVDFTDINFDHLKYELVRYAPVYVNGKEIGRIEPAVEKKSLNSPRFTLSDFDKDGVYAVKLTAVDKAGNQSVVSENTYMRMVDTDVLAYIEESDPAKKTGWYSIEDSSGPISKRPDSFKDLSIVVLSKKNADNHIVLLDENEKETDTGISPESEQDMFGVGMYRFTLPSGYFTENYTEDADTMLYLRVNSNDEHIDLGRIHIDNIAPKCAVPDHFKDWGWFAGSGEKTIKFSNITEILDPDNCIAYVTHKGVTQEVKMAYDPSDNSASITLGPGKYSVGVSLADRAGNKFTIPEISHLAIGNYRVWLAAASAVGLAALVAAALFIMNMIKRKRLR